MKNLVNQDKGFTLVELMVVVAIIGILSAVAIPNFRTYQAKSKTSEAKLQLASIYSVETSLMSDYDSYATCLEYGGYVQPTGNYYATGFAAEVGAANTIVTDNGGAGCTGGFAFTATKNVGGNSAAAADLPAAATVAADGTTFTAAAAGYIDASNGGLDIWFIDQGKSLVENQRGY